MAVARKVLDREGFIDFWAEYVRTHSDEEWSRQQNVLINSVLKTCKQPSREEFMRQRKAAQSL